MQVYEGKEKYIFVSYAHKDSALVLPILEAMKARGFRIWYDSGIAVGTEWPEYIATRLVGCDAVIAFMSPRTAASENCRNEINLAISRKKKILVAYIENTELSPGLELQIGTKQSVYLENQVGMASFVDRICEAGLLADCKGEPEETAMTGYSEGLAYEKTGEEYMVIGLGTCRDAVVTIPPYYEGLPVTAIGAGAFRQGAKIVEMIIPETVKTIGAGAFDFCESLANISLPSGLETLPPRLFKDCPNLNYTSYGFCFYLGNKFNPHLMLAKSDAENLVTCLIHPETKLIDAYAFDGCKFISEVEIPAGVKHIGGYLFGGKHDLAFLRVDKGNPVYHSKGNCIIETETGTLIAGCQGSKIPTDGSVTAIGDGAFYGLWNLSKLAIPHTITKIGRSAFAGCVCLAEIHYDATFAEWEKIEKGELWNNHADFCVVHCTDGNFAPAVAEMDEEERGARAAFVPSRGMKDKGMYGNMKVGMVVSLFAAAMLLALSLPLKMPAMLAPAVALLVLGAMFSLLGHTPKESLYLYFRTKETKLKKTTFVCICVILAVIIAVLGIVL